MHNMGSETFDERSEEAYYEALKRSWYNHVEFGPDCISALNGLEKLVNGT